MHKGLWYCFPSYLLNNRRLDLRFQIAELQPSGPTARNALVSHDDINAPRTVVSSALETPVSTVYV